MQNQYIFDIPVYSTNREDFAAEVDNCVAKRVEWIVSFDPQQRPLTPKNRNRQFHSVIAESGGPWQFNQVVGWLRLFAEGHTIGCHLWWVDARRLNRRIKNRRLLYLTTSSDILGACFPHESSSEIFDALIELIDDLSSQPLFKKRYIDLDIFRRVGPFFDWRGMLDHIVELKRMS